MATEKLLEKIDDLKALLYKVKLGDISTELLSDIRIQLDLIFGEKRCKEVYFTPNVDKMFFGVCVMPIIPSNDVINIFMKDDRYIIQKYYVELDSKLFDPYVNLNIDEITAIILHEVGMIVSDAIPVEKAKREIDNYLIKQNETIKLSDFINYVELLSYGIRDAIRKIISVFEAEENEVVTQFDKDLEIEQDITSAINKIATVGNNPNSDIDNKLIFLSWVLRLYKNVLKYRIQSIKSLKKGIEMSASRLEKKEMQNVIERLERIDDESIIKESVLDDIGGLFTRSSKRMKMDGVNRYNDEYYEFEFQVNNLENQDDAMLLIHQINSRMAVIDDLLNTEEINKDTRAKWIALYSKYNILRSKIAANKIYSNKSRLYVNYDMDD